VDVGGNGWIVLVGTYRLLSGGVQEPEGLDGGRPFVGQKGERDSAAPAEVGQNLPAVVADGGDAEAAILKVLETSLQLDELRLAVGSPVRRANEDEHCTFGTENGREGPRFAVLILKGEIGYALAHLRADFREVDRHTGGRLQEQPAQHGRSQGCLGHLLEAPNQAPLYFFNSS
jgi:hypothetical protein